MRDPLKSGRPNVIFVMLDTLRADNTASYGGRRRLSTIDGIAGRGVVYRNAISPGTFTVPSHVSIFLGKRVKGIRELNKDPIKNADANTDPFLKKRSYLESKEITLAKQMSYLGYETALFSNSPFISVQTGLASGFMSTHNVWINDKLDSGTPLVKSSLRLVSSDMARKRLIELASAISRLIPEKRLDRLYMDLRTRLNKKFSEEYGFYKIDAGARKTNALIDSYLKGSQGRSSFMFISYMEGHEGYPTNLVSDTYVEQDKWLYMSGLLEPDRVKKIREAYEKRIAYLDARVADLMGILKRNGALDNAVVVLASDHGQAFMEHGQMYHNMFPYEQLTRVPLITARFENGRQVSNREEVDKYVSLTALRDSIVNIGYGRADEINGQLRRDNFVFSDHVGITEVWDTYLLELLRRRSKNADAIYRTKMAYNKFATATYYKGFKLMSYRGGKKELYDLSEDDAESENVIGSNRSLALEMLRAEKKMN